MLSAMPKLYFFPLWRAIFRPSSNEVSAPAGSPKRIFTEPATDLWQACAYHPNHGSKQYRLRMLSARWGCRLSTLNKPWPARLSHEPPSIDVPFRPPILEAALLVPALQWSNICLRPYDRAETRSQ